MQLSCLFKKKCYCLLWSKWHTSLLFILSICLSKNLVYQDCSSKLRIHALIIFKGTSCTMYASIYTFTFNFAALRHWFGLWGTAHSSIFALIQICQWIYFSNIQFLIFSVYVLFGIYHGTHEFTFLHQFYFGLHQGCWNARDLRSTSCRRSSWGWGGWCYGDNNKPTQNCKVHSFSSPDKFLFFQYDTVHALEECSHKSFTI